MARPREFDTERALGTALHVFWERGYERASLTDLAEAMGIVRPSLQAAFGSKEDLYRQSIDLYGRRFMAFVTAALEGETAAEVCRRYLSGYCDVLADARTPSGCFMVKALSSTGDGAAVARRESILRLEMYESLLQRRFMQAQEAGDLNPGIDAAMLAQTLTVVATGLAIKSDMGADHSKLHRVADFALRNLLR